MSKKYEISELGDMLIYQDEKGDTKVEVYFFESDVWMSQGAIAQMYNTTPQNITMPELNRMVAMYLDFAEDRARRHIPMYMKDWEGKLNDCRRCSL
jgi:hypothetical protein